MIQLQCVDKPLGSSNAKRISLFPTLFFGYAIPIMSLPNDESFMRQARHVSRSLSLPFTQELRNRRRLSDQQQQQQLPQHHPYSSLDRTSTAPLDDQYVEEWPANEALDVEADVLFPQYKIESHDHADMEAFNEMLDRKMSADTETLKLSKTLSKHTKSDQKVIWND